MEHWVNNNFSANRLGDPTEINVHQCWGIWGLDRTPQGLRELVYNKYPGHTISGILQQVGIKDYTTITAFTQSWDPVRNNNWRTTFPDIVKFFD